MPSLAPTSGSVIGSPPTLAMISATESPESETGSSIKSFILNSAAGFSTGALFSFGIACARCVDGAGMPKLWTALSENKLARSPRISRKRSGNRLRRWWVAYASLTFSSVEPGLSGCFQALSPASRPSWGGSFQRFRCTRWLHGRFLWFIGWSGRRLAGFCRINGKFRRYRCDKDGRGRRRS